MKEEYIKKSDLLKDKYIYCIDYDPITEEKTKEIIGIRDYLLYAEIEDMPGADVVEVKHGHWLDTSNGWMCSICDSDSRFDTNFCPNCGADMRCETK